MERPLQSLTQPTIYTKIKSVELFDLACQAIEGSLDLGRDGQPPSTSAPVLGEAENAKAQVNSPAYCWCTTANQFKQSDTKPVQDATCSSTTKISIAAENVTQRKDMTKMMDKDDDSHVAALQRRIQELEMKVTADAKIINTSDDKHGELEALVMVLSQESAHLNQIAKILENEVMDLKAMMQKLIEKVSTLQRHITAADIRSKIEYKSIGANIDKLTQDFQDLKNDNVNEQILAKMETQARLLYEGFK